jgi:hypothetical protein
MEPIKRELRRQKREIKRAGHHRVRRELKRALAEEPEVVPDVEFDFGRYGSAHLNGIDRDPTRRRFRAAGDVDPDRDS